MRRGSRLTPGGLLPHLFTLTFRANAKGGILSVALAFPRRMVRGILLLQKDSLLYAVRTFLKPAVKTTDPRLPATGTLHFTNILMPLKIYKSLSRFFSDIPLISACGILLR